MIVDLDGSPVDDVCAGRDHLEAIAALLQGHEARFEWDPARAGLDVRAQEALPGGTNRGRLKAWSPRPGTLLLLLYKDSQVPFSTDRFAYGALIIRQAAWPAQQVLEVLDYLLSGLHPERRPACLKRAFPFTIPR